MKREIILVLVLILLASSIKYFYQFDKRAMFEFDQEYLSFQAKAILIDKKFTLIGAPTSVGGLFIGPFYNYFMALAHLIGKMNPYTVDFVSNLWAVATVLAIFLIAKNLINFQVAVFSSTLAIISFEFLRTQGLPPLLFPLPLISLLLFYLLIQKRINFFLVAFLIGFSFNLHFTALFFIPMVVFILIGYPIKKIKIKNLIIFFTTIILFAWPLIIFDLRHNFLLSKNFFTFLVQKNNQQFNIFTQFIRSLEISLENLNNLLYPGSLPFIKIILSVSVFAYIIFSHWHKRIIRMALIWLFIPVILFSLYKGHIINYYFVMQEPLFLILAGFLLSSMFTKDFGKIIVLILFVLLFLVNLKSQYFKPSPHGLFYKMQVFSFIKNKVQDNPFYLSYTIEPSWRGGWDYLTFYYKFRLMPCPNPALYPTYTIIQPHFWQGIKSDYVFGEIGVGVPKNG